MTNTLNQVYGNTTAMQPRSLRSNSQLLHTRMSFADNNNEFDVNGVATNFSKTCTYSIKGKYKYNFACIPSNTTNAKKARCVRFAPEKMPGTFDCDYFFDGQWLKAVEQEGLTCVGNCQGPPEAKVIGAGISTYPNFFTLTIAALLMIFMLFKRTNIINV